MNNSVSGNYISEIKKILHSARREAYSAVNFIMVRAYWLAGRRIVVEEQDGKSRADYGKEIIKNLSFELTKDFDKNFTPRRVREIRQFYLKFPSENLWHSANAETENWHSASADFETNLQFLIFTKLSWSHIRNLLRVKNDNAIKYYIQEAVENSWGVQTLSRNISSQYYERLLSSRNKEPVIKEMEDKTAPLQKNKMDFIKNPYVLEFLNIPRNSNFTESNIEDYLLSNIQKFLLELGKGFSFVARQKLVRTETSDFYIDLVFYNYILKCFVLIDLKTTKLTHQDVGQMDMYVRMFDDLQKNESDNPSIGILLCSETDKTIAKYSVLSESKQLFASKYLLYLPSEEELATEIERERQLLEEMD